ncbi:MAG: hypothetical protein WDO56_14290 [Gammaproteobacteria bacterium]
MDYYAIVYAMKKLGEANESLFSIKKEDSEDRSWLRDQFDAQKTQEQIRVSKNFHAPPKAIRQQSFRTVDYRSCVGRPHHVAIACLVTGVERREELTGAFPQRSTRVASRCPVLHVCFRDISAATSAQAARAVDELAIVLTGVDVLPRHRAGQRREKRQLIRLGRWFVVIRTRRNRHERAGAGGHQDLHRLSPAAARCGRRQSAPACATHSS